MPVGVVLGRRRIGHKWQEFAWRVADVVPGAPSLPEWRLLRQDGSDTLYLATTVSIDLYAGETPGYRHNLSQRQPVVYVVLRRDETDSERPVRPFRATVCSAEAQDYLDGDEIVETVPMPATIADWLRDFVARFQVDQAFEKRGRRERDARRSAEGQGRG
jgi:hypothetical protein